MTGNNVFGIDLAKNVFQIYGYSHDDVVVCNKSVSRKKRLQLFAQPPQFNWY